MLASAERERLRERERERVGLTNLELREHHKLKQYKSVAWERLGAEVLALGR